MAAKMRQSVRSRKSSQSKSQSPSQSQSDSKSQPQSASQPITQSQPQILSSPQVRGRPKRGSVSQPNSAPSTPSKAFSSPRNPATPVVSSAPVAPSTPVVSSTPVAASVIPHRSSSRITRLRNSASVLSSPGVTTRSKVSSSRVKKVSRTDAASKKRATRSRATKAQSKKLAPSGDVYNVEEIRSAKFIRSTYYYYIKWENFPESENSWEPSQNLGSRDLADSFRKSLKQDGIWKVTTIESGNSKRPAWINLSPFVSSVCDVAFKAWIKSPSDGGATVKMGRVHFLVDFNSMTFTDLTTASNDLHFLKRSLN